MKLKRHKIFFLAVVVMLSVSCRNKDEKSGAIPDNVLKQEEFARLLTDYALAEGAANMNILNVSIQRYDSVYAFNPLLDNKVRATQYDSTVAFYVEHPELYKKVYELVLENLSRMQLSRKATATSPPVSK